MKTESMTTDHRPEERPEPRRFGDEFKVYGDSFALDTFRGMNRSGKDHVVNLKMARKIRETKTYDWTGDWISMQISADETGPFLATLLGYRSNLSIQHFNDGLVKKLELRENSQDGQGNKTKGFGSSYALTMKTNQRGSARTVRLEEADRLKMAIFVFRVFMKNNGGVGQDVLYAMLKDIYGSQRRVVATDG